MKIPFAKTIYIKMQNLTSGLFFFKLLISGFLLFDFIVSLTGLMSIENLIKIHSLVLIASIFYFIIYFWKETKGDFFSFINIVLLWYIVMYVIPIFLVLKFPLTHTKPGYWDIFSIEYSVGIVIIGLYSLVIGYELVIKNQTKINLPISVRPSLKRMGIAIVIIFIFYVIYLFLRSHAMGGTIWDIIKIQPRSSKFYAKTREYSMGVYTLINFLNRSSYLFYMCFMLPRDKNINYKLRWLANSFIVFSVVNIIFSSIIGSSKSGIFGIFLLLFCLLHYKKRKIKFIEVILLFLIGIGVLVTFNYLRIPKGVRLGFDKKGIITRTYAHTFEDFETLAVITSYIPREHQYYYGEKLKEEIFWLPIPRYFWKNKPYAYGNRAVLYDISPIYFVSGFHTGLHSQFYLDFGILGVVLGFLIFGGIIGWIYKIFKQNSSNMGILLLYIMIIGQTWIYLKGGFPWLNLIIMNHIPFCIFLYFIYPKKIKEDKNV